MCELGATLVPRLCPEIIPCGRKYAAVVKIIIMWNSRKQYGSF